ncbi:MAG: hypothetical protein AAFZ65_02655, partial [Planctomycetota bacterium]
MHTDDTPANEPIPLGSLANPRHGLGWLEDIDGTAAAPSAPLPAPATGTPATGTPGLGHPALEHPYPDLGGHSALFGVGQPLFQNGGGLVGVGFEGG